MSGPPLCAVGDVLAARVLAALMFAVDGVMALRLVI
jgi:hypothetical protein